MMETLEKLCKIVERRLDMAVEQVEREGGKLPAGDAEYLDNLAHTLKSIKTIMAMEGYGRSERRGRDSMGRFVSRDGGSYGESYGMGGYSGARYAYADDSYEGSGRSMHGDEMREKLQKMANETRDERVRRALEEAMRSI